VRFLLRKRDTHSRGNTSSLLTVNSRAAEDASKATAKVKAEIPGRGKEAQKEVEKLGHQAGAKFDSAVDKVNSELGRAEANAKVAKADAMKKVNEFDRKVEAKTAEAKSGISSWFGGK